MTICVSDWTDLDPANQDHESSAWSRGEHLASRSPVLTLLDKTIRTNLTGNLAHEVFPRTSPVTAEADILDWLTASPMSVFTQPVLALFAATYAQAWFPSTKTA